MNDIAPSLLFNATFLESLSEAERAVVPYMHDMWLRPEQSIPRGDWRSYGMIAGRGWGKTHAVCLYINGCVERGELPSGEVPRIALMAPTEERAEEVQIKSLIELAPPWFKPERSRGGILWPNDVRAVVFTPEAPGRARGGNFALTWACELVDWNANTRKEAWEVLATATRVGQEQIIWDTTSKGLNDLIQALLDAHESDPHAHLLQRGTTFDNYFLSRKYMRATCAQYVVGSRRYREEVLGEVFTGSAGAHWEQSVLDEHRRLEAPRELEQVIVAFDPALSNRPDADESGIIVAGRGRDGHVYLLEDLSGRYTPAQQGAVIVDACLKYRAAGVIVETNRGGDQALHVVASECSTRGIVVQAVPRSEPIPRRTAGRLYLRSEFTRSNKLSRASGPAAETSAGRVHIVGHMHDLEIELCTYEQGTQTSPNRYDAAVYAIIELSGIGRDSPKNNAAEVRSATEATRAMNTHMRMHSRGARVGL